MAENGLFRRGERVAVGVSGGKDSTVLVHVLHALNASDGSALLEGGLRALDAFLASADAALRVRTALRLDADASVLAQLSARGAFDRLLRGEGALLGGLLMRRMAPCYTAQGAARPYWEIARARPPTAMARAVERMLRGARKGSEAGEKGEAAIRRAERSRLKV